MLGERLFFPRDFIGRGDMSRGALLLQRVDANHELDYVPFATGVVRRGPRAPGIATPRSSKPVTIDPRDPSLTRSTRSPTCGSKARATRTRPSSPLNWFGFARSTTSATAWARRSARHA